MSDPSIPTAKPIEAPKPPALPAASTRAVATLILGILSLICLGFLAGVPAIILGNLELKAIKAGQAPAQGEGVAKVGFILGIVGTILTCLSFLAVLGIVVLGASLGAAGSFHSFLQSV